MKVDRLEPLAQASQPQHAIHLSGATHQDQPAPVPPFAGVDDGAQASAVDEFKILQVNRDRTGAHLGLSQCLPKRWQGREIQLALEMNPG